MSLNMSDQIFLADAYLCLWLPGAAGWLFHLCVYVWWVCLVHYSAVKFQWQQAVMVMTSLGHDYCSGPGWRCGHIVTVTSSVVVIGPFVCGDWVSVGWHCVVAVMSVIVDECSDVVGDWLIDWLIGWLAADWLIDRQVLGQFHRLTCHCCLCLNSSSRAFSWWACTLPLLYQWYFRYWFLTLSRHCCHMGTAIKHRVRDRVRPSFVIFDIRHSDAQLWASECPDVKNY